MNQLSLDIRKFILVYLMLFKSCALGKHSWCLENSDGFSLKKDYSSKWVGEKFPSFIEKNSKIRSHVVKKSNVFVSQNMNFMKISNIFSNSKNGFGTFLVKNVFHQWSDFHSKKYYLSKWGGQILTTLKHTKRRHPWRFKW